MRRGGMAFGAHTVDHPVLARCPIERQRQEIEESAARLHQAVGALKYTRLKDQIAAASLEAVDLYVPR